MNLIKHLELFNAPKADDLGARLVIGAGSVGSEVALGLAKLGLTNLTVMDHDRVAVENIPNQYIYGPEDVGYFKVDCAAPTIETLTGYSPNVMKAEYGGVKLRGYHAVYACVDSMAVRRLIFEKGTYLNPDIDWLFDVRTGVDAISAFVLNPKDEAQRDEYAKSLCSDEEIITQRAACGVTLSLGPIAQIAANLLLILTIKAFNGKLKYNEFHLSFDDEIGMRTVCRSYNGSAR